MVVYAVWGESIRFRLRKDISIVSMHTRKLVLDEAERLFVLCQLLFLDNLINLVDTSLKELGVASHHLVMKGVSTNFAYLYRRKTKYWFYL